MRVFHMEIEKDLTIMKKNMRTSRSKTYWCFELIIAKKNQPAFHQLPLINCEAWFSQQCTAQEKNNSLNIQQ